jgi:hypothetical protein
MEGTRLPPHRAPPPSYGAALLSQQEGSPMPFYPSSNKGMEDNHAIGIRELVIRIVTPLEAPAMLLLMWRTAREDTPLTRVFARRNRFTADEISDLTTQLHAALVDHLMTTGGVQLTLPTD